MLGKFAVWVIQKLLVRKLRNAFGKEKLVAIKSLLNNYSSTERNSPTHKRNRPTYIKEFKHIGLDNEDFINELDILQKKSQYLIICEDIYLALLFINKFIKGEMDMRNKSNQDLFDETISHLDYLVFNYKL